LKNSSVISPSTSSSAEKTSLRAQILALQIENQLLREELARQNERIEELEAKLKWYENAHTPPSEQRKQRPENGENDQDDCSDSDENQAEDADIDDAGGDEDAASDTSPGRNPGHDGTTQPPPEPDRTVTVDHAYCPNCDCVLSEPDEYDTRTIVDIPHPVPTEVTKFKLGKQTCDCGAEVVAEHPDCPDIGRFGPNLLAQTALLRYRGRLPHRVQAELFDSQLAYSVSHGTIYRLTKRVADQLRPAYEEIKAQIQESDVVYCDETGFPVDGEQQWLWTFVTDEHVLYHIDESRGSQVLENVLGDSLAEDATLSCDGWAAYPSYHMKLQRCWAHLLREADYVAERHREAESLAERLHDLHDDLTEFDNGDPSASAREEMRAEASLYLEGLVREEYEAEEVQELQEKIRNGLGHWLTFVTEPDVDSTNNRAERALREQVIMRKVFGGLRSAEGVRIHETITTVLNTWEQQGLDPPEKLRTVLGGREPPA